MFHVEHFAKQYYLGLVCLARICRRLGNSVKRSASEIFRIRWRSTAEPKNHEAILCADICEELWSDWLI